MKKLRELKARRAALVKQASDLNAAATAANRDLTDDELGQFEGLKAQILGVDKQIEAEQFLISQNASAAELPNGDVHVTDNLAESPTRGFQSFGEFAAAVKTASLRNGAVDPRLTINAAAPGTYGSEGVGQDGGFALPPQYSTEIWTHSLEEQSLLPFTDNTEVSGNSMVFPKDETTPWGTDGIRAYWQAEATQANATKPKIGTASLRLHKLMALVPITDELLQDAVALGGYLTKKLPISIRWKTDEALLWGSGAGQPQGALNGNALVTVAKESGQATLTLQAMNLANMIARLPQASFSRAFWLMNNDVLPSLFTLTLGNYPVYLPPSNPSKGGIQLDPYGTLFGRPVVVTQHAKSFSNAGDISLLDMSYYRTITKAEGITTAMSLHLYFDADAAAFRATYRIDGAPSIQQAITPANGSKTLSPFIQLGAR